ncbi:MAG: nucleoside phosphorylase [Chloroflexota bacterium]|nr:nucleoside phosphorylase [Chloroflexota bacterium]MBI5703403.1 nucleoside phosphorylase [Chloroflexota bacterium]
MSFPNFPEKHTLESLLKPEDIVGYRGRLGRLPKFRKLEGVLFCLERGLPRRLRWRIPIRRVGSMNADVYEVKKNGAVVLTNFGGGSPIVAELAEELAAMGARRMAVMTAGGILQEDLQAGDVVVCTRAIRDEGTSHHYLPPAKFIEADSQLAGELADAIRARGVSCSLGTTWTTDAPYRETLEEVRQYQAEGVKTVEMESAGLFTVGQVRGLPTASVVIALDSLSGNRWRAPERLDNVMRTLDIVYTACIEVLGKPR